MRKQTSITNVPAVMNECIVLKQELKATVNNEYDISHKQLVIEQQPVDVSVAQQIDLTVSISLSSTNPNQQGFSKITSLIFQVYQDAENGSRIEATNKQFCYSGKLNSCIDLIHPNISECSLRLFFLQRGTFKISVLCSDEETQDMLTSPTEAIIVVK